MNIDYKTTPYLQFRLVKRDSLTGDIKNETVEIKYNEETNTFTESTGATKVRFGPKAGRKTEYPIEMWDERISMYLRNYELATTEETKKKTITFEGDYKHIVNRAINAFVNSIVQANNEMIRTSYTKDIDDIPKECLNTANDILIYLQSNIENITKQDYNAKLRELFIVFPMAVSKSDHYFIDTIDREQMKETVSKLQEKVDGIMQMLASSSVIPNNDKTILEANDVEMREVTEEEEEKIKEYMSDQSENFVRAYKVTNHKTEKRFNEFCAKEGLTEKKGISHLWHGTGYENLWSIFKSGMYLNPALIKAGVRICGKAFGYGIYFAPYCRKSMGYTSSSAAIHRGGNGGRGGYLLLFKVATGDPYYIYRHRDGQGRLKVPQHWADFHKDNPGKLCTWAEAGQIGDATIRRLCYDEVIVYQESQCTIEYVVEFSNIKY